MMRHAHFYDAATGIFSGKSFSFPNGREDVLRANTPEGCSVFEGDVDHLCQRIDIASGKLVDYVPPQPDADHEWNGISKRWVRSASVEQSKQSVTAARFRISELESMQSRAIREHLLRPNDRDPKDSKTARERLQAIDDEIAALRAAISAAESTSAPSR